MTEFRFWNRISPVPRSLYNRLPGGERGAVFVDLAFALPIFLAAIFIILWYSYMLNARAAITAAVTTAARLAVTRGDVYRLGYSIVQYRYDEQNAGEVQLYTNLSGGYTDTDYDQWSAEDPDNLGNECSPSIASKLPMTYHHALVYAYRAMADSVGSTLRFPCDPTAADGDGCVTCYFELFGATCAEVTAGTVVLPKDTMILVCDYKPYNLLMAPILGLLKTVSGDPHMGIFTRKASTGSEAWIN